jgi:hypothetical protein
MTWDDVLKSYANLGSGGEGVGPRGIADIARHRRDRGTKTSPRRRGDTEKGQRTEDRNTERIGAIEFANHHTGHTEDGLRLSAAPITVLEIRWFLYSRVNTITSS